MPTTIISIYFYTEDLLLKQYLPTPGHLQDAKNTKHKRKIENLC